MLGSIEEEEDTIPMMELLYDYCSKRELLFANNIQTKYDRCWGTTLIFSPIEIKWYTAFSGFAMPGQI